MIRGGEGHRLPCHFSLSTITEGHLLIITKRHTARRLLAVIGEDKREEVLAGEVATITGGKALSLSDASFLIEIGRMDEAETYLIDRSDRINGDFYDSLLPLAEALEKGGKSLGATVVYRALLDSILRRARSTIYPHGIRYLKWISSLPGLAPSGCRSRWSLSPILLSWRIARTPGFSSP